MSPSSHLYCERPGRPPLGERGPRGMLWGGVGTAGGRGGAGQFQPRVPVAAGLGFVCRMDIVMSNERLTRDVMCQPPSFSLRRKIRLLRRVPARGAPAPEAAAGAQGCAWAACRAQARGSGPGGAGARAGRPRLLLRLLRPPPPCSLVAVRQGPRLLSASGGRLHERAARPGRRWRRGEGLGQGGRWGGPREAGRAGVLATPRLCLVCPVSQRVRQPLEPWPRSPRLQPGLR